MLQGCYSWKVKYLKTVPKLKIFVLFQVELYEYTTMVFLTVFLNAKHFFLCSTDEAKLLMNDRINARYFGS